MVPSIPPTFGVPTIGYFNRVNTDGTADDEFTPVPCEVILADPKRLSSNAKVLYMHLAYLAGGEVAAVCSRATLGERLGRSVDTVDRAVRELVDYGAICVERRMRPDGSADESRYVLAREG